jgi:hypothetical protein
MGRGFNATIHDSRRFFKTAEDTLPMNDDKKEQLARRAGDLVSQGYH